MSDAKGPTINGGTALAVFGAYQSGMASASAYKEDAALADYNARMTAADTEEQVARQRAYVRRTISAGRAATGANGIQLSGSALLALGDVAAQGELDALTIQHEGNVKELSYKLQAGADRKSASAASSGAGLNAAAKLLGG